MNIPDSIAAKVLSACARHCCICRRFRPDHLQIHHIVTQAEGGGNDLTNLIPVCVYCHTSVHSENFLSRNFTAAELRAHRDSVYDLVSKGLLPQREAISGDAVQLVTNELVHRLESILSSKKVSDGHLSKDALMLLMSSVAEEEPITFEVSHSHFSILVSGRQILYKRQATEVRPLVIEELIARGYIRPEESHFTVTADGLALIEKTFSTATYYEIKVKCMGCSLHFIILTWFPENHSASSITCPECGRKNHWKLVSKNKMCGFIFQRV
jgi:ribosomal protein S27E